MRTEVQERVMRERFADEKNPALAGELGVSVRTVARWAREMGLSKSAAFWERVRWDAFLGQQYAKLVGRGVGGGGRKGGTAGSFGRRMLSEEEEEKRKDAIRKTAWEERKRVLRGEKRRTGWKMVDYGKGKVGGKWQKA